MDKAPGLREKVYRLLVAERRSMVLQEMASLLTEDLRRVSDALRHLRDRGLVSRAHLHWRSIQPPTPPCFGPPSQPRNTRPEKKDAEGSWLTQADREWQAYWRMPRDLRRQQPVPVPYSLW